MQLTELAADGRRQLEICNACRYCEGLCDVFPAIERRTTFDAGTLTHLANLCHDCRACLDACPFAPPHELAVDIPLLLSTVRERTYSRYAWPSWLGRRVDRNLGAALSFVALVVLAVVGATALGGGLDRLLQTHTGRGSFYKVIPWMAMMVPFALISVLAVLVMVGGAARYWGHTDSGRDTGIGPTTLAKAIRDAATLRNLRGGGQGCPYPGERPTRQRQLYHSGVFYGFVLAFASTASAAILQDGFGELPPYSWLSVPVLTGSAGGALMLVGCLGLLALKRTANADSVAAPMRVMDVTFLVTLILINLTGFALLLLRETAAMGLILDVHLGLVAALFLTLPYGKFPHGIYRFLALVRDRSEIKRRPAQAK